MKNLQLITMSVLLVLMTGCTAETQQEEIHTNQTTENDTIVPENEVEKSQKELNKEMEDFLQEVGTTTNKDLENQIKEESSIINHNVLIMEKVELVLGELEVAKEVKDAEAKALAEKYAKQLKAEYPKLEVSITVQRDGQELTTFELE